MYNSDVSDTEPLPDARRKVAGPAIALIVASAISLLFLLLSLAFSAWLVFSGVADEMRQPPGMSKESQVVIRMIWNVMMQVTHVLILLGAIRMRRLKSPTLSRMSCILAVIPCLGPCFLLGIPFGIWGLVVMNDPEVRRAFEAGA